MKELADGDLKKQIATAIQKEIEPELPEGQDEKSLNTMLFKEFKSLLEVDLLYMGLKECRPKGNFSIEVSFRTKLWNIATKKVLYNKIFISTNTYHISDFDKPYYYFLTSNPICRRISSYCDENTRSIFQTEINNSVRALAQALKREVLPHVK